MDKLRPFLFAFLDPAGLLGLKPILTHLITKAVSVLVGNVWTAIGRCLQVREITSTVDEHGSAPQQVGHSTTGQLMLTSR